MLRVRLLVAALVAASAACAPLARAASVTIAPAGGGAPRTLELDALAGAFDVHGATYTLRAADGATSTVTVASGISVGALLAAAGVPRDAFGYIVVPGQGAAGALLLADELSGTGEGPPVVWSDQEGAHVLRPARDAHDVNAEDLVTAPDGTLTLELEDGDPVKPQLSVSTLRPRAGEAVGLSASLAVGELRPGWGYAWYLGDGSGLISGASLTHRFRAAGTYPVQVNVVDASGQAIGPAGVVYLRVRAAPPPHGAHGAGDGDAGAATGAVTGGTTDAGGGNGSGGGGHGAGSGTTGARAGGAAPSLGAPSPSAALRTPARAAPPSDAAQGRLVSGTLIASASAAPPLASGGGRAAGRAAADRPLHVPIGAWVALGLAALLGLGWALESRHTLPFWQP